MSYLEDRLKELCITEKENVFEVPMYNGRTHDPKTKIKHTCFTEDDKGNIVIHYYNLVGSPIHWSTNDDGKKDRTWSKPFTRTRLQKPLKNEEGKEVKYIQPAGSGKCPPYFPPEIIRKYIAKEKIATLFMTEGEFKSFVGSKNKIDIIGIGGIHGFYGDEDMRLHPDIIELIKVCGVEKLVLLHDADATIITYHPEKDLAKRPMSFFTAVKNFREACMNLINKQETTLLDCYYMHILPKFKETGKGIDDFLLSNPKNIQKEIIKDLHELSFAKTYFWGFPLVSSNINTVKAHFGILNTNNPNEFYNMYKEILGNKEFLYFKVKYYHDGEECKYLHNEDAEKFFRVGTDWFKRVMLPSRKGVMNEELKKWNVAEIKRDYGKSADKLIGEIPKYEAFINIPCNYHNSYQRVINNCFNVYHQIKHIPKHGSIANTIGFLKHVFGGTATVTETYNEETKTYTQEETAILGDPFTVALDYLTIQFKYPDQILPVPCLVSPENNTGKSTFGKWLQEVYGNNVTILGNEEFNMPFNSHFITKFIIVIDEGFIEMDKKSQKERLKKLATDERQFLQFKGVDMQEIDFYGKLIICSNEADRLMKIDEGEIRWFVVKVPVLKQVDPDLRQKMYEEIPAWIAFMMDRAIHHPKESRAWFNPKYIITDQLRKIIEETQNYYEKEVDDFVTNLMLNYKQEVLYLPLDYIVDHINKTAKYKVTKADVKHYLVKKNAKAPDRPMRFKIPRGFTEAPGDEFVVQYSNQIGRPYTLYAADFLSEQDLQELREPFEPAHTVIENKDLPF